MQQKRRNDFARRRCCRSQKFRQQLSRGGCPEKKWATPLILNSQDNQGNSNLPKLKYEQRRRRQNHIQAAQAGRTASPAATRQTAPGKAWRQGKKHHTKKNFRQPHKKIARGTLQGQNSKIHGKKIKKNDPSQTHSWTESQESARFLLGEKKQISPRGFFRRFLLGGDRFFLGEKQIFSRGKTDFFSGENRFFLGVRPLETLLGKGSGGRNIKNNI